MTKSLGTLIATLVFASPAMTQEAKDHNNEYRTFSSGDTAYDQIGDSYNADLAMFLAGNQFMAMEHLITDFQGQINGEDKAQNADLFARVNLGHLKMLSAKGMTSLPAAHRNFKSRTGLCQRPQKSLL